MANPGPGGQSWTRWPILDPVVNPGPGVQMELQTSYVAQAKPQNVLQQTIRRKLQFETMLSSGVPITLYKSWKYSIDPVADPEGGGGG